MAIAIKRISASTELRRCGVVREPAGWPDFHALPSNVVRNLLESTIHMGYREPAHANGSRARYFYAALCRQADSGRDNE